MMNKRSDLSAQDRISELPKYLLDNILVSLPLEEAVRTSILSREWKGKWVFLPHLVFDAKLLRNTSISYHVLLNHHGIITKFHLDSPLEAIDHLAMSDWVQMVSTNFLQDLKICVLQSDPCFKLPCSFFSCQKLRHVKLHYCEFNPPAGFGGFTHLVDLVLQGVKMESKLLGSLLCRCPLLESLTLEVFHDTILKFHAPKLKFLLITGTISHISITAPNLATLLLVVDETDCDEDLPRGLKICGSMTVLEKFISKHEIIAVRSMLKASPSCLSQVKYIELHDFLFMDDLKDALFLLRGVPDLQKLIVKEFLHVEEDEVNYELLQEEVRECYDEEISKEILLCCLESVDITTDFGYGSQEFIKFLLERSSALCNLHIQISSKIPIGTGLANFLQDELLKYPRASPTATVSIYLAAEDL